MTENRTPAGAHRPEGATPAEGEAVTVRSAGAADQHAALALLGEAALPLDGVVGAFPVGYVVAVAGGRLVGVAGVERYGRWGLLRSVAVAHDLRSVGLGARVVGEALSRATAEGVDEVYLLTTTAAAFFTRLGFRTCDRASVPEAVRASAEFASICPASAACMALRLGGPKA